MYKLLFSALFLATYATSAIAQSIVISNAGRGKDSQYVVAPGTASTQKIVFYFISNGNSSNAVAVSLTGPPGITAELQSAKLKGAPATAAKSTKPSGWLSIQTDPKLRIKNSSAAFRTQAARVCSPELLEQLRQLIENVPNYALETPQSLCDKIPDNYRPNPGTNNPTNDPTQNPTSASDSSVRALALLRKDNCASVSKYIMRMIVDISKVDAATLASGFTISASFLDKSYTGKKAATLKESSDGKYRGQPLMLMTTTGYGERLFLLRWSGNSLRSAEEVKIRDYVGYRGLRLTRSTIGQNLTGGQGTFELINGNTGNAYGVCFNLVRSRQRKNGYPGGD